MIEIEIEKRNQFREQSAPIISQIEVQEIETAHKSVVSVVSVESPCFPCFPIVLPPTIAWLACQKHLPPKFFKNPYVLTKVDYWSLTNNQHNDIVVLK